MIIIKNKWRANMSRVFYEKIGRKYQEVGYEFSGWPANGIWVVEDGKRNCIYQFGDVPEKPTPSLASYMQFQDELMKTIVKEWDTRALNARDISEIACKFFALKAGGMDIAGELIEN